MFFFAEIAILVTVSNLFNISYFVLGLTFIISKGIFELHQKCPKILSKKTKKWATKIEKVREERNSLTCSLLLSLEDGDFWPKNTSEKKNNSPLQVLPGRATLRLTRFRQGSGGYL